jgi:hypothetical protein
VRGLWVRWRGRGWMKRNEVFELLSECKGMKEGSIHVAISGFSPLFAVNIYGIIKFAIVLWASTIPGMLL